MMQRRIKVLSVAMLALALGGCGADIDEIREWMDQQRKAARPNVTPLNPPKSFVPQSYQAMLLVEPFSGQKMAVAMQRETAAPSSLLAAQLNRRKEPLEAYPLDAIRMVGSLSKRKNGYALVRADNLLYQVKVGDYLGQNFGKITKITETAIELSETVQDAVGEWVVRPTTIELQETAR